MSHLASRSCEPVKPGTQPLAGARLQELHQELGGNWQVIREHHLEKEYRFEDFRGALDFTQRVGELAEKENHHPDIELSWGKVRVTIWTHVVDGLSESDFIFAAKADQELSI